MNWSHFNHIRLLRYAGLFTYLCVGVPLLLDYLTVRQADPLLHCGSLAGFNLCASVPWEDYYADSAKAVLERRWWTLSYLAFGLAYWWVTRGLGIKRASLAKLALLIVMNAAAVAVTYYSRSGVAAILFLVVAGVLPWLLPRWAGIAWLALQNFTCVPVLVYHAVGFGWFESLLQSFLYFGLTGFSFVTSLVAKQQTEAREEQRRTVSELRATRALLAESSRIGERLRISRELHDLVGHHLTALSLNLEVASHLVQGPAQDQVRKAQSVAKLLLSDVREVVSQLREDDAIDLGEALRLLVEGVPQLQVHLDVPPRFALDDPKRAQVLLRCTQEIITNAVRHAAASHLWLRLDNGSDPVPFVELYARDDGHGADQVKIGNGLTGMRERLAEYGGTLAIDTGRDRGFALTARLPLAAAA